MKQTKIKLLCLLLAALMLLSSLTACGKDKAKDSNLIKLGDYELLYKGACIMEDSDGNDAIVLTLDFTNNGKENASYLWSVDETLMQNGVELEAATVFADYDTFETVIEGQFTDVAPGATVEVRTAYLLQDTTSPVEATFEQFLGKKSGKITIDPSTLSRVEAARLFDRFYTVDSARGSTGLGLSIAKLLTEKLHGTISADYENETLRICIAFPTEKQGGI